jgi:glutaminyl-peptide cyclotransferase
MVGVKKNLHFARDPTTPWLTDLVWSTAARLGYSSVFVEKSTPMEDDHLAFARRKVPVVDVIDYMDYPSDTVWPYWHTPQDTMDKISPRSLAITGHVFIETVRELETGK